MRRRHRCYPALAYPQLDSLFRDLLAANRSPGYGVDVTGAAPDLSVIEVDLRFIAGRTYCCAEPGCHVPIDKAQRRLRKMAAERAILFPEAVTVRWHCRVEEGVKLECLRSAGVPAESEEYDFEVAYGETAAG